MNGTGKKVGMWLLAIVVLLGGYFGYSMYAAGKEHGSMINDPVKTHNGKFIDISGITEDMNGQTVSTRGYVEKISSGKGNVFWVFKDLNSGKSIKGCLFKDENYENTGRQKLLEESLKNKTPVKVDGTVKIYKGELEVVASKVYK